LVFVDETIVMGYLLKYYTLGELTDYVRESQHVEWNKPPTV